MNSYARRMMRDGRNPYSSRGGYVTSREPRRTRRDRGDYDEYPMDSRYDDYGRSDGHYRKEYDEYPYAQMRGTFEYDRYSDDDCCYYDDMRDYRGGYRDERGRMRNGRGQYVSRDGRRDYGGDEGMELSKRDIRNWERDLINDDGTRGAHWDRQQVEDIAKKIGINPEEFGDGTLWIVTNSMYSDYCTAAKKFNVDRPEFYIELAKAFLKDKDFDGSPEEKAMLYYKCIVEQED